MSDPFADLDRLRLPGPVVKKKVAGPPSAPKSEHGAWVPWLLVERAQRLRLRPTSRWQVFFAILVTSCRFGGKEARLTVQQIAERTGLSTRTVKGSLVDLIRAGHVRRMGRYGRLVVTLLPPTKQPPIEETELPLPS